MDPASDGREDGLVMTGVFTKWTAPVATSDQSAASVVKVLVQDWIEHYGAPLRLHSGNGQYERFNRSMISSGSCQP